MPCFFKTMGLLSLLHGKWTLIYVSADKMVELVGWGFVIGPSVNDVCEKVTFRVSEGN